MRTSSMMSINNLYAEINMPPALKSRFDDDGNETDQVLPRHEQVPAWKVQDFAWYPDNWAIDGPNSVAYFVVAKPGCGMWIDFNANNANARYVAVRLSIQGLDPITGQKANHLRMEQYRHLCPIHGKPFTGERFCPLCGYRWPPQNYLTSAGNARGDFWLDGFMAEPGVIRQYIFTEDVMRGMAAQIIGEARTYSIGIAFYLSKAVKPTPQRVTRDSPYSKSSGLEELLGSAAVKYSFDSPAKGIGDEPLLLRGVTGGNRPAQKKIEIAAGARIGQRVEVDPLNVLTDWDPVPAGIIMVNYTDQDTADEVIRSGRVNSGRNEGFMKARVVGN